jgi:hypothetical protein
MQLSEETIELLKNFATINTGLVIKPGSVLKTITSNRTVLATARVVESFPVPFIVLDLNTFLAKLSLYRECELEFEASRVWFKAGRRTDYIMAGGPDSVKGPPDRELALDNPDYEFLLKQEDLTWMRKSAGISGSEHFVFRGDGKNILLQATTMKNDSSDLSSTTIGETKGKFACALQVSNFKILDGNYRVKLSKDGLAKFEHEDRDVQYYIAVESGISEWK